MTHPSPRPSNEDVWPVLQEALTEFRSLGTCFLRRHGLSFGQYLTLHRIQKSNGLRLSTLAEELGISRPATTELVESLEARGWVLREHSSTDRRGVVVRLTARAVRVIGAPDRDLAAVVRRTTEGLPRDRREGAVETLRALSRGLREYRDRIQVVGEAVR